MIAAWFVGRAFSIFLLAAAGSHDKPHVQTNQLLIWDGLWYRQIMEHGYGQRPVRWPPLLGDWSTLPFFPLFPFSSRLLHALGAPMLIALTLLPHLAALAGAFGVYRLARTHYGPRVAMIAVWVLGVLPGALTFSMAYPDSLFMAGCVWAVVLASERRPVLAGLAALVATAARPNGALILVSLAVVTLAAWPAGTPLLRSRSASPAPDPAFPPEKSSVWVVRGEALVIMAAPSAVFLACWCWFMNHRTGDPLAFLTAKSAWEESNLLDWLTGGGRQATFQLLIGVVFLGLVLSQVRRIPPAWTAQATLCIAPSLVLGMVGMARYSAQAFAVPIVIAVLVAGRRALMVGMFATLVVVSGIYSVFITRYGWVP